ncbi:MAG: LCP family protein, partial [Actinomycetota bacterium]
MTTPPFDQDGADPGLPPSADDGEGTSPGAPRTSTRWSALRRRLAAPTVAAVVALPGVALWKRRPVVASLLVATGITAPLFGGVLLLQHWGDLVDLFTRPNVLRGLSLVAVAAIAARVIAVLLTSDTLEGDGRRRMRRNGSLAVAALVLPAAFGVWRMEQMRSFVNTVFQPDSQQGAVVVPNAIDPLAAEYQTVLMLGSDEGDDRVGLRTDTMIIAMVHLPTGHTALVSVPRNLKHVTFPEGSALARRYPDGYDDLVNALHTTVLNDPRLTDAYTDTSGTDPGIRALQQALSTSLGITINDYVLVNSCAFVNVVDAIGGVTIEVDKELPMPATLRCSRYRLTPTIGPGSIYMDGTQALGYVRSRTADSDYQRMERQRILLQAIADQVGIGTLLADLTALAAAVESDVQTSMTVTEARTLLAALRADDGRFESVGLVPPIVKPGNPDYPALRGYLQQLRRNIAAGLP